jgi:hypothetical protein
VRELASEVHRVLGVRGFIIAAGEERVQRKGQGAAVDRRWVAVEEGGAVRLLGGVAGRG